MRHTTEIVPRALESRQLMSQSIASTLLWRIQTTASIMAAWARHVAMKANTIAGYRTRAFEFAFASDMDQTSLLVSRGGKCNWFRLSFIDGGGRHMEYSKDMFAKFTSAIGDNNQNDADPTLLFIATDGNRLFKAFAGPASSVVGGFQVSKGFDDGVFIGIWSHDYLRDMIVKLEETDDPDNGWSKQMEDMVMAISDYADANPDLDNTPRG